MLGADVGDDERFVADAALARSRRYAAAHILADAFRSLCSIPRVEVRVGDAVIETICKLAGAK